MFVLVLSALAVVVGAYGPLRSVLVYVRCRRVRADGRDAGRRVARLGAHVQEHQHQQGVRCEGTRHPAATLPRAFPLCLREL